MPRPLLPLVVAFMAGIAVGYSLRLPDLPLLAALLIVFPLIFFAFNKKRKGTILLLTACALFILGILDINRSVYSIPKVTHIVHYVGREKLTLEGIVDEAPQESENGKTIFVAVRSIIKGNDYIPAEGPIMLSVPLPDISIRYGDLIRVKTRLRMPHNFQNPGSFDYAKQLRGQGILLQGRVNNASEIVLIRGDCGNLFKTKLEKTRSKLRQFITENSSTPEREIIQALLLGDVKPIQPEVRESFNRTGTSHILAISGFNVGIVVSFFVIVTMLIMKPFPYLLLRFNVVKISAFIAVIPVLIYTFIAGLGVSVIRAAIMIMAFLIAVLIHKERDMFNALALAALIILLINPTALFDVSFQLTFAAVASLIYASPLLTSLFRGGEKEGKATTLLLVRKILDYLLLLILTTLIATLGTLPLVAYHFNGISTVSLLANCIAVPIIGAVALLSGMGAAVAAAIFSYLAVIMIKFASISIKISLYAISFLSSLPGSFLRVTTPSIPEIACYYLLLAVIVKMMKERKNKAEKTSGDSYSPNFLKLVLAALVIFFVADGVYFAFKDNFRRELRITAVDVGQGSSILMLLPAGKNILIDGGGNPTGSFDVGKYVLAPYLWRERIKELDIVILTHPHPDHFQGLVYILENFRVKEVWTNGSDANAELYRDFIKVIKEKRIVRRIVNTNTPPIKINGIEIAVLNPSISFTNTFKIKNELDDVNNSSLAMRMVFGKVSFLLGGDIGAPVERRLMETSINLKSDVIFVPHHGGFASSTPPFIDMVKPRVAVISCGLDNIFNLPHPDVLKRYAAVRARIYRTDLDGGVTLTTDGDKLDVETANDGGKKSLIDRQGSHWYDKKP